MENKSTNHTSIAARLILVAIGLGALYWILESVIDVLIFHEGNLVERLLTPDPSETSARQSLAASQSRILIVQSNSLSCCWF